MWFNKSQFEGAAGKKLQDISGTAPTIAGDLQLS